MLSLGPWDLFFQKRIICPELGNLELKSGQNVVHGAGQRDDPGRITVLQVSLAWGAGRDTDMDD